LKRAVVIVTGFVHDFAAGIWAATVLSVWWIHRSPALQANENVLRALMQQFFWIGVAALVMPPAPAGRSPMRTWARCTARTANASGAGC
jgi:hypothetical protein